MISRTSKYELVGQRAGEATGTLVDVGARDKRLKQSISPSLKYLSADMVPGFDLLWNLEEPINAPDKTYDIVVALDVLEHVERIHKAYCELLRVTKSKLFISLPNMSNLTFRWNFLWTGKLSAKYDLLSRHQGDRHRWLTCYPQMNEFVSSHAKEKGFNVEQFDIVAGYGRMQKIVQHLPISPGLSAYTVLYELTRK